MFAILDGVGDSPVCRSRVVEGGRLSWAIEMQGNGENQKIPPACLDFTSNSAAGVSVIPLNLDSSKLVAV